MEYIFVSWAILALIAVIPLSLFLEAAFPIFTVILIGMPLIIVLRTRDAGRVGFRRIDLREFLTTTAITLALLAVLTALVEPWTGTYRLLIKLALAQSTPDLGFVWFVRYEGPARWGGMLLYMGLVALFGEELFFRGWLLQHLRQRTSTTWAIVIQAVLFDVLQLFVFLVLPPWQGVIYIVWNFVSVGLVCGWAAARTRSIWPSLISATVSHGLLMLAFTKIHGF
jgi:membrane protease YdiL (CAAX protease family)